MPRIIVTQRKRFCAQAQALYVVECEFVRQRNPHRAEFRLHIAAPWAVLRADASAGPAARFQHEHLVTGPKQFACCDES
jgi:hypothetical protein